LHLDLFEQPGKKQLFQIFVRRVEISRAMGWKEWLGGRLLPAVEVVVVAGGEGKEILGDVAALTAIWAEGISNRWSARWAGGPW
jgi:hypothetical protein